MPKSKKENIEDITLDPIEEKVKEPAPVEEPVEEPETVNEDLGEEITEPDAPIDEFEEPIEEPVEGEEGEDAEFDEDAEPEEETEEDAPEEDAPPFLGLMLGAKNAPVSEDPDPQSRIEALLWHIINGTTTDAVPQSRNEAILTAIANSGTYTEEAQSRIEALLIAILNHEEVNITPISRNEAILKAIANSGEYDEEPQSRNEELLLKWLEAWGVVIDTASGAIANFTTSLALPLVSVKSAIVATGGGGTPSNPIAINGFNQAVISHSGEDMTSPTTYTLALGQTVYGGEIVLTKKASGYAVKLRVNSAIVDLGTLANWSYDSANQRFYSWNLTSTIKAPSSNSQTIYMLCSDYVGCALGSLANYGIAVSTTKNIYIKNTDYDNSTINDFIASLSGAKLIYELATPIEIDLTDASDIVALVGTNNVWSDTGDMEVSYKKKQTD